jgi:hypothetical protein
VRPGGRVIVIEGEAPAGWLKAVKRPARPRLAGETILEWLSHAGLRAARVLADVNDVVYAEAARPR